jgi:type IVB pilus formation R64 PilN family outer membrane protein
MLRYLVVLFFLLGLAGCAVDKHAGKMTDNALQNAKGAWDKANAVEDAPVVSVSKSAWLLGERVQAVDAPSPILSQTVVYHSASQASLAEIAAWIQQTTQVAVDTTGLAGSEAQASVGTPVAVGPAIVKPPLPSAPFPGASPGAAQPGSPLTQSFSIDYSGSLSGLLDICANKTGSWWKFDDGKIVFFTQETKIFFLPANAIVSNGTGQINTTSGSSGSGSSGSSSSGGSSSGNSGASTGGASQTSTYKVDMWAELEKAAKVVAGTAQISTNAALGAVTVTGTPTQVRAVGDWVKGIAESLGRQIALDVNIYSVQLNKEDNYNFDPKLLFSNTETGLNLSGPDPPPVTSGLNPMKLSASVLSTATGNTAKFSNSQVVANALSTLGRVSQTLQQTVITQSGQPAPMQVGNQLTYLASVAAGTPVISGSTVAYGPPTLTPGTVTTGFTAMFLPRLVDGKILLSMNMTNSTLLALNTVSSGSGDSLASIQTPNVDISTFQQSVTLTPGDSLLLTGLQKDIAGQQNNGMLSPYNWIFGGGSDAATGRQLIAIVITAKVI